MIVLASFDPVSLSDLRRERPSLSAERLQTPRSAGDKEARQFETSVVQADQITSMCMCSSLGLAGIA